MRQRIFSLRARAASFRNAFRGLWKFIRSEDHAVLHLISTLLVITASFSLQISRIEWLAVLLATGLVWMAEIFNTCIEKMLDFMTSEKDSRIRLIKDMSAGAVLVTAIIALIVALIIFMPRVESWF
jgi:diacylglycerol kinase (ATP)